MRVLAEHHRSVIKGKIVPSGVLEIDRAIRAYTKNAVYVGRDGCTPVHPSIVQLVDLHGKLYVVLGRPELRNTFLRVYRVRAYDGILRMMKRWPSGLNELADPSRLPGAV